MMYCKQVGCDGHLGKFNSCRDEALYQMSLDGFYPDTGDVEFEGHFTLIELTTPNTIKLMDGLEVTVPVGIYLLSASNSGAVDVIEFNSLQKAQGEFNRIDANFAKWMDS